MYIFIVDCEIGDTDFRKGMTSGLPFKVPKVSSESLLPPFWPFLIYSQAVKSYGRKLFKKMPLFRRFATLNRSRLHKGWVESKIFERGVEGILKIYLGFWMVVQRLFLFWNRYHQFHHFLAFFRLRNHHPHNRTWRHRSSGHQKWKFLGQSIRNWSPFYPTWYW